MSQILSDRERAFVEALLRTGDRVEAARLAGYSARSRDALRVAANRVMARPRVRRAIELAKASRPRTETPKPSEPAADLDALAELEAIARGDAKPATKVRALELLARLRREREEAGREDEAPAAEEAPRQRAVTFYDNGRGPLPPEGPGVIYVYPQLKPAELVEKVMKSLHRAAIVRELARLHRACDFEWPAGDG